MTHKIASELTALSPAASLESALSDFEDAATILLEAVDRIREGRTDNPFGYVLNTMRSVSLILK